MKRDDFEVNVFKALAHPVRLKIVKCLLQEEKCVCDINKNVEFSQSNLSQHLRILKDANVVEQRKDKTNIYYRVAFPEIGLMVEEVDKITNHFYQESK